MKGNTVSIHQNFILLWQLPTLIFGRPEATLADVIVKEGGDLSVLLKSVVSRVNQRCLQTPSLRIVRRSAQPRREIQQIEIRIRISGTLRETSENRKRSFQSIRQPEISKDLP